MNDLAKSVKAEVDARRRRVLKECRIARMEFIAAALENRIDAEIVTRPVATRQLTIPGGGLVVVKRRNMLVVTVQPTYSGDSPMYLTVDGTYVVRGSGRDGCWVRSDWYESLENQYIENMTHWLRMLTRRRKPRPIRKILRSLWNNL